MSPERRALVFVALLIAGLVAALGLGCHWAKHQLLDTDEWVATSDEMIENDTVRAQIADFIAEAAPGAVPPEAGGPADLSQRARRLADAAVGTPRFERAWRGANRTAHRTFLRILDGDAPPGEREVTVDLRPVVQAIGTEAGLPAEGLVLPDGTAEIRVVDVGQLETASEITSDVRSAPLIAALVTLALWAIAAFQLRRRPAFAVAGAGLSLVLAGAVVLVARTIAGDRIVDSLVEERSLRPAAHAAWGIASSQLQTLGIAALAVGIAATVGALAFDRFRSSPL